MRKGLTYLGIFTAFFFVTPLGTHAIEVFPESCMLDGVPTLTCAEYMFQNLLLMSAGLVLLVLFVMFIIGGFNYLTSFGNPEKVKKAQGTLKFAVLGVVLYMSSFLILKTIDAIFLGNCGKIFTFQVGADVEECPDN